MKEKWGSIYRERAVLVLVSYESRVVLVVAIETRHMRQHQSSHALAKTDTRDCLADMKCAIVFRNCVSEPAATAAEVDEGEKRGEMENRKGIDGPALEKEPLS